MNDAVGIYVGHGRQLAPQELSSFAETSAVLNELHARVRLKILSDAARFRARLASISVSDSRYTLVSYGTDVRLECEYDTPSQSAILCLRGSCIIEVDGVTRRLAAGDGVIGRPRQGLSGQFSHDCERLVVRTRHKPSPAQSLIEDLHFDRSHAQALIDLVQAVSRSPALLTCIAREPAVARPFSEVVAQILGSTKVGRTGTAARSPLPGAVLRVERVIRQRAAEPLTLADLAAAGSISERTLQAHFQRYHGCTPMQYLREIRLDAAKAMLDAGGEGQTVGMVASRCGFTHLSRFALEYRRRFGESPSKTRSDARKR